MKTGQDLLKEKTYLVGETTTLFCFSTPGMKTVGDTYTRVKEENGRGTQLPRLQRSETVEYLSLVA